MTGATRRQGHVAHPQGASYWNLSPTLREPAALNTASRITHRPRTLARLLARSLLAPLVLGSALQAPLHAATPAPAVRVDGNRLVNAEGKVVQLRGVNVGSFGPYAIQGWSWDPSRPHSYDNWGQQHPDWAAMLRWGVNAVRLPLNEASWLGLTTYDPVANSSGGPDGHRPAQPGNSRRADPGGNYREQYIDAVKTLTGLGLYVIVDLHANGPDIVLSCVKQANASGKDGYPCRPLPGEAKVPMTPFLPDYAQSPLPDADHSPQFWTSVATTFKGYPNVIFDLFNEPFIEPFFSVAEDQWTAWLNGTIVPFYYTGGSRPRTIAQPWRSAGMQELLNTVRATGATNVVIVGGLMYAADMEGWLAHEPVDPLHQLAAAWHPYPKSATVGDPAAKVPNGGSAQFRYVEALARTVPVVIGETGDHSADGTEGAPFVSILLPWADSHGVSYLGWGWNVWGQPDHGLIKNFDGTPTDGYGRYFREHLQCRAAQHEGDKPCR